MKARFVNGARRKPTEPESAGGFGVAHRSAERKEEESSRMAPKLGGGREGTVPVSIGEQTIGRGLGSGDAPVRGIGETGGTTRSGKLAPFREKTAGSPGASVITRRIIRRSEVLAFDERATQSHQKNVIKKGRNKSGARKRGKLNVLPVGDTEGFVGIKTCVSDAIRGQH